MLFTDTQTTTDYSHSHVTRRHETLETQWTAASLQRATTSTNYTLAMFHTESITPVRRTAAAAAAVQVVMMIFVHRNKRSVANEQRSSAQT